MGTHEAYAAVAKAIAEVILGQALWSGQQTLSSDPLQL